MDDPIIPKRDHGIIKFSLYRDGCQNGTIEFLAHHFFRWIVMAPNSDHRIFRSSIFSLIWMVANRNYRILQPSIYSLDLDGCKPPPSIYSLDSLDSSDSSALVVSSMGSTIFVLLSLFWI